MAWQAEKWEKRRCLKRVAIKLKVGYIYLWVDSFSVSSFRVFVVQNLILSEARRVGLHDSPLPSSVSLAPFMGNS